MKSLFVACLFALCVSCGLPTTTPVAGIYDVTTNDVTSDSPAGCTDGGKTAEPMTVELVEPNGSWSLFICGQVGADCSQRELYAISSDGYVFTIVYMFTGSFDISYHTAAGHTSMSGTGHTTMSIFGTSCSWDTAFNGTKR